MLWVVEATRLGESSSQRTCVDADTWQRALETVRKTRGEGTELGSFSVELVADAVRAVDPMSRVRFVVEQAPPGAKADLYAAGVRSPSAPPRPRTPPLDFGKPANGSVPPPPNPVIPPNAAVPVIATASALQGVEAVGASLPGMSHTLCTKREQEPTPESPLVYREYTFAVPPGTSAHDAERVLRMELGRVQRALESKPQGVRYVNLAAFDHTFTDRPARQPLATLSWKDWSGKVVATHPGLAANGRVVTGARTPTTRPGGGLRQQLDDGAAQSRTAPLVLPQPAPALVPGSMTDPFPSSGHVDEQTKVSNPAMDSAAFPSAPPPPSNGTIVDQQVPPSQPKRPGTSSRHRISQRKLLAPPRAVHASSDELIAALFDVMHDLNFATDALQGGSFCLEVVHEVIPHDVGFAHMYDVAKRNFVVASMRGTAPMESLASRVIESDSVLSRALRAKAPAILSADKDSIPALARHSRIARPRSLVVAPLLYGTRVLGALEIVGPEGGEPFTQDEAQAIGYVAGQYAEFIASHGIVLDRAKILAHALG